MSLLKLPLILVTAWYYDRSFIPPKLQKPFTKDEQKRANDTKSTISWYEQLAVPILPPWTRILFWLCSAVEAAVILAQSFPSHELAAPGVRLFNTSLAAASSVGGNITPTFLFGAFLIIAGAMLRFRCFREMGHHFTFAMTLRDDHSLITTGPYSVVRHPAYTGGNMNVLGALLVLMGDGSWWLESGKATFMGQIWAINFLVSGALIVHAFLRGAKEDSYLKQQFAVQWEAWAKNVPYRYIPGVV